jgi:hypothetical protein
MPHGSVLHPRNYSLYQLRVYSPCSFEWLTHPHGAGVRMVSKISEIGTMVVLPRSSIVGVWPASRISDGAQTIFGRCGVCIGRAVWVLWVMHRLGHAIEKSYHYIFPVSDMITVHGTIISVSPIVACSISVVRQNDRLSPVIHTIKQWVEYIYVSWANHFALQKSPLYKIALPRKWGNSPCQ